MTWEDAVVLRGVSVEWVMKSTTGRTKQRLRMFIENNCRFLKQLVALATKSHACLDRTDGVDSSDVVGLLQQRCFCLFLLKAPGCCPPSAASSPGCPSSSSCVVRTEASASIDAPPPSPTKSEALIVRTPQQAAVTMPTSVIIGVSVILTQPLLPY